MPVLNIEGRAGSIDPHNGSGGAVLGAGTGAGLGAGAGAGTGADTDAGRAHRDASAAMTAAVEASASNPRHQLSPYNHANSSQAQWSSPQQQQQQQYPHQQHQGNGIQPASTSSSSSQQQTSGRMQSPANSLASTLATSMPTTAASLMREGPRDFTVIRDVGDGSFGTVCLADWKSPLPSGTMLSPMQHPTTRPEYIGKRLVAIKKMKKPFPNWEECMKLKELKSLLAIPAHPNLIPLYDAFLMPGSKELHFVFECMEGNLYQLTKSRKGRPLAGGLVASIFQQIVRGLHHIHLHGYFHRDMKPENLLITTTGLADYPSSSPTALPGTPAEKDVLVIVKLADFGLARETNSRPPYTEYVSTRWYRAPEVLLRSRDYSNPVDVWALGTIMAEIVNLKPLFPGQSEVDQVLQICEVLGDPTREYGLDERGRRRGGGEWQRGIKMARAVGFEFPLAQPLAFPSLFSPKIPSSLVECIQDMLRYDPRARLTTHDLLNHHYYATLAPRLQPPQARAVVSATTPEQQATMMRQMPRAHVQSLVSISSTLAEGEEANARRAVPPSHSTMPQAIKPPFGVGAQPISTSHEGLQQRPRPQLDRATENEMALDIGSPNAYISSSNPTILEPVKSRESGVSQYPAFPESVSTHTSIQFNGVADDIAMSSPAHRSDAAQEPDQYLNVSHRPYPPSHDQSTHSYARAGDNAGAQSLNSTTHIGSNASSEHDEGKDSIVDGSNETLASGKDKSRGKASKGWGLNISSVLGHKPSQLMQQQQQQQQQQQNLTSPSIAQFSPLASSQSTTSITPAQQIIAAEQARSQVHLASASPADTKKARKEAEKAAREAEKARRAAQERAARERARAVMQKRNQILASSNSRDQVEWLTLAENDMTRALQAQQNQQQQAQAQQQQHNLNTQSFGQQQSAAAYAQMHSPRPSLQQQQQQQGQQSFYGSPMAASQQAYGGQGALSAGAPYVSMSEKAWGKQPRVTHTGTSDHSGVSSRLGASGSYSPMQPGAHGMRNDLSAEFDPRRQSMQSYHTRDSDPGPARGAMPEYNLHRGVLGMGGSGGGVGAGGGGSYGMGTYRPETTSSLNSAPSVVDAASSYRARMQAASGGDRSSIDTRSVASSLDNQLILNMENMTAAESTRTAQGSPSPGPTAQFGGVATRPSYSRQSVGSRTGSAHRAGSASPLHHTPAPRFHPYSSTSAASTMAGGGGASLSNSSVALPSSAHSSSHTNYPLPSLASIANSSGSDMMENLQTDISSTVVGAGPRPRSKTRRPSHGAHSLPRGLSRGSATSRDGSLRHTAVSSSGTPATNSMFNMGSLQSKASTAPTNFIPQQSEGAMTANGTNYNGPVAVVSGGNGKPVGGFDGSTLASMGSVTSPAPRGGGNVYSTTTLPPFSELAARTKAMDGYYYSSEHDGYDG